MTFDQRGLLHVRLQADQRHRRQRGEVMRIDHVQQMLSQLRVLGIEFQTDA